MKAGSLFLGYLLPFQFILIVVNIPAISEDDSVDEVSLPFINRHILPTLVDVILSVKDGQTLPSLIHTSKLSETSAPAYLYR